MKTIDIYRQFFAADCVFSEVQRKAALVTLTAESDCGMIRYTASASFFPHTDEEDFAVSYDAEVTKELYYGKGRRSKKRDSEYLEVIRETIDAASEGIGGRVFWDKPLREAQIG